MFPLLHVWLESSKTCYFCTDSTNTTFFNNGLCEPCLLWTNSSYVCYTAFFWVMHCWCLIWVKFVKIPQQKCESQLNVIDPYSVLWFKACCFSQSERLLCGNFIIESDMVMWILSPFAFNAKIKIIVFHWIWLGLISLQIDRKRILPHIRPRHKYPEKCSKNLSRNSQFFP